MKTFVYSMKGHIFILSSGPWRKGKYLFLNYGMLHKLVGILWDTVSKSLGIMDHTVVGSHACMSFHWLFSFARLFCYVQFCFALLFLIVCNSWPLFASVQLFPSLIVYGKKPFYIWRNTLSFYTGVTCVTLSDTNSLVKEELCI